MASHTRPQSAAPAAPRTRRWTWLMMLAVALSVSATLLAQEAGRTVTLPLPEYNRLLDLAAKPLPPTNTPPLGAVVTSADLRVRVARDVATGVVTLSGEVMREGIQRVETLPGGVITNGTSGAGRPLAMTADRQQPAALIQGVGPFTLTLDWGAPVSYPPGRAAFQLPVPAAGTAHASIDLPGDQADVRLSHGLVTARTIANGRTTIEATLVPGSTTEVSWSMRDSAPVAATREVRTIADLYTLVTIGEADLRLATLVDVSVLQGELRTIAVTLPVGYELASVTGASIEGRETRERRLVLSVANPAARQHQFMINLERAHDNGSFSLETATVMLPEVQREKGEIAIEGAGTLELEANERDNVHRMDIRELHSALASMSRAPLLAAFRYQRGAGTIVPAVALNVKRFGDAGVLAAVADRGTATTMLTEEGRALTEMTLIVRNRAQPFMKVVLPEGATLASVDVAGQPAKPVTGADGTRIPLLRPGFRPVGTYTVSFVYLHGGAPLAKRGDLAMMLPKLDLPVGLVEWELFVPERYTVQVVGGNVLDQRVMGYADRSGSSSADHPAAGPVEAPSELRRGGLAPGIAGGVGGGVVGGIAPAPSVTPSRIEPGAVFGRVLDETGESLPGALVELTVSGWRAAVIADDRGAYYFAGAPAGPAVLTASLSGFQSVRREFTTQPPRTMNMEVTLGIGSLAETVTVAAAAPIVGRAPAEDPQRQAPPQSVLNLQRRAAGVLPIRIDVPRAGASHRFIKPLVLDQDTTLLLRYKRR